LDGQSAAVQQLPTAVETHRVSPHALNCGTLHTKPHWVPSQVGVAFCTDVVHAVHDVAPQLLTPLLETHVVPHRCVPELHVNPHFVPSQVAVALAGGTHAVHEVVPHELGLVLDWQVPLQS
jgi:hypothetical protein